MHRCDIENVNRKQTQNCQQEINPHHLGGAPAPGKPPCCCIIPGGIMPGGIIAYPGGPAGNPGGIMPAKGRRAAARAVTNRYLEPLSVCGQLNWSVGHEEQPRWFITMPVCTPGGIGRAAAAKPGGGIPPGIGPPTPRTGPARPSGAPAGAPTGIPRPAARPTPGPATVVTAAVP